MVLTPYIYLSFREEHKNNYIDISERSKLLEFLKRYNPIIRQPLIQPIVKKNLKLNIPNINDIK